MELLEYVLAHPEGPVDGVPWNWAYLSQNPGMTQLVVQLHRNLPWNHDGLCQNPNMTFKWLRRFCDPYHLKPNQLKNFLRYGRYTFAELSQYRVNFNCAVQRLILKNPQVTMAMILAYPQIKWEKLDLSCHSELTLSLILRPPPNWNGSFSWRKIGAHAQLTLEEVLDNPCLPWVWPGSLLRNPRISLDCLLARGFIYSDLYLHPGLTLEILPKDFRSQESFPLLFANPLVPLVDLFELYPLLFVDYDPRPRLGLTLQEVKQYGQVKGFWEWAMVYLRDSPNYQLRKVVERERTNRQSYFSRLPRDMWFHYLQQYVS